MPPAAALFAGMGPAELATESFKVQPDTIKISKNLKLLVATAL
jgi:hypothetical protein